MVTPILLPPNAAYRRAGLAGLAPRPRSDSATTLRRLFKDAGLDRIGLRDATVGKTRLRVEPLLPEDTAEYLRVRLQGVGCERELFGSDAVAMLHESASGALRDIDRLATAALKEAARRK